MRLTLTRLCRSAMLGGPLIVALPSHPFGGSVADHPGWCRETQSVFIVMRVGRVVEGYPPEEADRCERQGPEVLWNQLVERLWKASTGRLKSSKSRGNRIAPLEGLMCLEMHDNPTKDNRGHHAQHRIRPYDKSGPGWPNQARDDDAQRDNENRKHAHAEQTARHEAEREIEVDDGNCRCYKARYQEDTSVEPSN